MMKRRIKWGCTVALLGLGVGCGQGGESTANTIAAAMGHVASGKDEAAARVNAGQRMKELREAAAAEAVRAKDEAFAAIIAVPDKVEGNLDVACGAVASTFDAFHRARLQGAELERWQATRQPDLDKLAASCRTLGNTKVAACQAHAFSTAGPLVVTDDAPFILSQCEERGGAASTRTAAL